MTGHDGCVDFAYNAKGMAEPFEIGRIGAQHGVDPNTLGRGSRWVLSRDRYTVQRTLIESRVARATPIRVYETGRVYDGHHGVRAAIDLGVAVDVEVFPGTDLPAGPPAIREMPFDKLN